MPHEIERSRRSRADLLEIWSYIAQTDEGAAFRFFDRVDEILKILAEFPELGRERPHLGVKGFKLNDIYGLYYA